ncbi:MAG: hypothetical protein N0E48_15970 [Candidatus Thiodiazotropha endolucinida]|nr:hypothetical protein [Candidatus Thiodiazotropha taylori]MCW4344828.1 hypothetical protein [Candidatus Thiodiazotropha endolucinida]
MSARYTALSDPIQVLSSDLNNLNDGAFSRHVNVTSIIQSRRSLPDDALFANFVLSLANFESPRSTSASVSLFLVPNHVTVLDIPATPTLASNPELAVNYHSGTLILDSSSVPYVGVFTVVNLPSVDFFPVILNRTGVVFPSSGNVLRMYTYGYEDVT